MICTCEGALCVVQNGCLIPSDINTDIGMMLTRAPESILKFSDFDCGPILSQQNIGLLALDLKIYRLGLPHLFSLNCSVFSFYT